MNCSVVRCDNCATWKDLELLGILLLVGLFLLWLFSSAMILHVVWRKRNDLVLPSRLPDVVKEENETVDSLL